MEGSLNLVTGAATETVSLADAKHHLRVDITDDDVYIAALVQAVRDNMERQYTTAFITQTWDWYLDGFPGSEFELPIWPAQSVTSIKYTDEDDNESTYNSANYRVDVISKPARVTLKTGSSWPSDTLKESNAVVIRFVAGYGDAQSDVPMPVRQAILLRVADLYENRENLLVAQGVTMADLHASSQLMANYRGWNS